MFSGIILFAILFLTASLQKEATDEIADKNLMEEMQEYFSSLLKPSLTLNNPYRDVTEPSKIVEKVFIDEQLRDTSHKVKRDKLAKERSTIKPKLSPLFHCNHYDDRSRDCINVRQLGTTLTVGVKVEIGETDTHRVHWFRFFKKNDVRKTVVKQVLKRDALPWNINIGGDNTELRISPITEIDFSYNFFLASLTDASNNVSIKEPQYIRFSIEPINIEMGNLYHGEEITINVRSFMELPKRSIYYEWASIVGDNYDVSRNLPSNMKMNRDKSSINIKEYRSQEDRVLACAVYSNKGFFIGRRNYFLRKIVAAKNPNVRIDSRSVFRSRQRRYLDEFYDQPTLRKDRSLFIRRKYDAPQDMPFDTTDQYESTEYESTENRNLSFNQSISYEDFSEIDNSWQTSTQSNYEQQKTVINFYLNPEELQQQKQTTYNPTTDAPPLQNKEDQSKMQTLNEFINEANSIIKPSVTKSKVEYPILQAIPEERLTFEDKESLLIAYCRDASDCGVNAVCLKAINSRNFCKCKAHYKGNGIFCWLF